VLNAMTLGEASVDSTEIVDGAVTAAKIGSSAVTSAKIAANAVTQAKLASNVSGITITTTADRSTDIPSPFTGQFIFLTDTSTLQRWNGSEWVAAITTVPTAAPTSLSASNVTGTTVDISFSAGADGGSAITNYEYALSTNGGSSYGEYAALSPADGTSPITITGLSNNTSYNAKLKAVNALGTGSSESSAVSFTTVGVAAAPTGLAGTALSTTSVSISFSQVAPTNAITNYKYALSTNGGSSYGAYTALSPADATSPITISELTHTTTYHIKLRAVNSDGDGAESSATSVTTVAGLAVEYLVLAGGGGGGSYHYSGGGGAGGYRNSTTGETTGGGGAAESPLSLNAGTSYSVIVGGGAASQSTGNRDGNDGNNSTFATITSTGGGGGDWGGDGGGGHSGGSGGGGAGSFAGGAAVAPTQGHAGGGGGAVGGTSDNHAGGGGGAGAVGGTAAGSYGGSGGNGLSSSITGSAVTRGGGGGGSAYPPGSTAGTGGSGGGGRGATNFAGTGPDAGSPNTGGGGGGASHTNGSTSGTGAAGGSGIVILRYPNIYTITVGAGLTAGVTNGDAGGGKKYTTITAGSGNVSWS
jgi:hypothetical protein